jgi:circadian clock protein KaiB
MSAKKPARKSTQDKGADDSAAKFEKLLTDANKIERFVFRLYITGNTIRSSQAIANIRAVCEDYLAGRYELEVVDIYQQPKAAAREQIIAAPTLIKKLPAPVRRLIGNLSDRAKILVALNLTRGRDSSKKPLKTR